MTYSFSAPAPSGVTGLLTPSGSTATWSGSGSVSAAYVSGMDSQTANYVLPVTVTVTEAGSGRQATSSVTNIALTVTRMNDSDAFSDIAAACYIDTDAFDYPDDSGTCELVGYVYPYGYPKANASPADFGIFTSPASAGMLYTGNRFTYLWTGGCSSTTERCLVWDVGTGNKTVVTTVTVTHVASGTSKSFVLTAKAAGNFICTSSKGCQAM